MNVTLDQQRAAYEDLICNSTFDRLKTKAIEGKIHGTGIRGLCWKLFLGCIECRDNADLFSKRDQWLKIIAVHRKEYTSLSRQYQVDPHSQGSEQDPLINHPLSQNDESIWKKFWQNQELEKEINQDIERTYPENEFFQRKDIREMMLRILFIYARQNPKLAYKQGMHELLAPFLYILELEKIVVKEENANDELSRLMDANFVEHDAFTMFNHLMRTVKEWFVSDVPIPPKKKEETKEEEEPLSPVVKKCRHIQYDIVRKYDPQLFSYLTNLQVEPQLYMLRWIRVLLGREFHLADLLLLWDAIFAHSSDLVLLDFVCVSMLLYIRDQLIHRDYTSCMRRLFKYPPVEDIHLFIEKAFDLMKNNNFESHTSVSPNANIITRRNTYGSSTATTKFTHKIFDPLAHTVKHMIASDDIETISRLESEIQHLRSVQTHMANRIERIVYSLQKEAVERPEVSNVVKDSLEISIAELKQVKDILTGLLPVENQLVLPPLKLNLSSSAHVTPQEEKQPLDPLGASFME